MSLEVIEPVPHILIAGGGHVGMSVSIVCEPLAGNTVFLMSEANTLIWKDILKPLRFCVAQLMNYWEMRQCHQLEDSRIYWSWVTIGPWIKNYS